MGINTNLLNFIDERIKKILSKLKILKYKSATVQSVNMDKVTVKFEDGTIMTLPNNSGSFVSPYIDSSNKVLVYYWGNTISENNAYIGKNAHITSTSDYICIGSIGSRDDYTTFCDVKQLIHNYIFRT